MDIKKGMRVRILPRKAGWRDMGPSYTDRMMGLAGAIFVVEDINRLGSIIYRGYAWHTDWLVPLEMENE